MFLKKFPKNIFIFDHRKLKYDFKTFSAKVQQFQWKHNFYST